MAITIKTRTIAIGVILSLFLTFFGGWYYGYSKEKKRSETAQNSLRNEIERLTVEINDTEYHLTRTEQELITERQLRKQDVIDKETLKALNIKQTNEITKLKLRIDTLLKDVEHNGEIIVVQNARMDSLGIVQPTVAQKAIKLPFRFEMSDTWLKLKGDFDENGKLGVALKMDVSVDLITGINKKTKAPTASLMTDNPYIKTINIRSYKTDTPKPRRYGIGAVVGWGVTNEGFSPFVGVGLSYNLLTF